MRGANETPLTVSRKRSDPMFGLPVPQTDGGIVAATVGILDGTLNAIASLLPGSLRPPSPVSRTDRPSYKFGLRFG